MIDKVVKYIYRNNLFCKKDKLLLAISGGADSVALMHFLLDFGVKFELAHANFNLRGNESKNDEIFVKNLAQTHNLKIHVKSFKTKKNAEENKISLQMAARNLRYEWFANLLKERELKFIVTAHHRDDIVETFFINLIRGSGIRGLLSIPAKNDCVIRPFLCINRSEIDKYLLEKQQIYREDSSNVELKYFRNKVRSSLIPLLEEMNPSIKETVINEINILRDISNIFHAHISKVQNNIFKKESDNFIIQIDKLKKLSPLQPYLFEILRPFEFNQIDNIIKALDGQSGKYFYSKQYKLLINRDEIIIKKREIDKPTIIEIDKSTRKIENPLKIRFSVGSYLEINKSDSVAQLDFDKLQFPLILRKWNKGDKFHPLGMRQFKKISDFFIDNKLSQLEKEDKWLLCSNDNIVWVVGSRIDNRFKITANTKKLYIAELLNS